MSQQQMEINKMVSKINIFCWNCKGVMSSTPYLSACLKNYDIDICALSEHWLRSCNMHFLQQVDREYSVYAKSIDELLPANYKCTNYRKGVALLVSRRMDRYVVREIEIDTDRIVGVELHLPNELTMFVFCYTYQLPLFRLKYLRNMLIRYMSCIRCIVKLELTVIFARDFNANVRGPRVNSPKGERCKYLQNVLDDLNLISLNTQECCTGPTYTFQGYENGPCTNIVHIIIPIDVPLE